MKQIAEGICEEESTESAERALEDEVDYVKKLEQKLELMEQELELSYEDCNEFNNHCKYLEYLLKELGYNDPGYVPRADIRQFGGEWYKWNIFAGGYCLLNFKYRPKNEKRGRRIILDSSE